MTTVVAPEDAQTGPAMGIDVGEPYSDGWWLKKLADQLKVQQKECDALQQRYEGNGPIPFISDIQRDAVKWFVQKSRTNTESVIVNAVLSRLRIRGIRTAVDSDQGGDADAYTEWLASRGPLWARDVLKMALVMRKSAILVGKRKNGRLIVTAEDPRLVTWIPDPEDPYTPLAGLKLFHDDVANQDVAYLYLPGRVRVARKSRVRRGSSDPVFNPSAYWWDDEILADLGDELNDTNLDDPAGVIEWLAERDDEGKFIGGRVPLVPFVNEDEKSEFEPYLNQIDRINQQILQRMTIATIQAFKQRAVKGAPRKNPDTNEVVDYGAVFTADPGAIWMLPETAEIWESDQVDLSGILNAIRDDLKDLYATSGTPAYLAAPDAANSSAESASLQREMTVFKVETRQTRFGPSFDAVLELMFLTLEDEKRAVPGKTSVIWAPAERLSMSEKSNAVAQTKGVVPRYAQLTDIMGYDPAEADRMMTMLTDDMVLDQRFAAGLKAAQGATNQMGQFGGGTPADNAA